MRATTIMFLAAFLYVVHRWATNKKAVDPHIIVEAVFAILVIALLDQGKTEPVARGFAWLFLAGAAYATAPVLANLTPKQAPLSQPRLVPEKTLPYTPGSPTGGPPVPANFGFENA